MVPGTTLSATANAVQDYEYRSDLGFGVFEALVARCFEDKEKVLASTAAYAAVLAVFVGLLVVAAAACPGLTRSSVFRGRDRGPAGMPSGALRAPRAARTATSGFRAPSPGEQAT
jgi:hypothetical protein